MEGPVVLFHPVLVGFFLTMFYFYEYTAFVILRGLSDIFRQHL